MDKKQAVKTIAENLKQIRTLLADCVKISNETGVCFRYSPDMGGQYTPKSAVFDKDDYVEQDDDGYYRPDGHPEYAGWETSYC